MKTFLEACDLAYCASQHLAIHTAVVRMAEGKQGFQNLSQREVEMRGLEDVIIQFHPEQSMFNACDTAREYKTKYDL